MKQMSHTIEILEILRKNEKNCEEAGEEIGSYLWNTFA